MVEKLFKLQTCTIPGVQVQISGDDYRLCDDNSDNRWSNTKKGAYGKGILNKKSDPRKTERIGLLGETALARYLGVNVDFEYKHGGDEEDFVYNGARIDIKCASKLYPYESGLIYAQSAGGRPVKLKAEIYAFGYLELENREKGEATINLLGFLPKNDIIKLPLSPAKVGFHLNYEVPYGSLIRINKIRKLLAGKI